MSLANMAKPKPSCRCCEAHWTRHARLLAEASAGSSSAARMAMIAMTTSNSIRVKAELRVAGLTHWHFFDFISAVERTRSGFGSQRLTSTDLLSLDGIFLSCRRLREACPGLGGELLEVLRHASGADHVIAQCQCQLLQGGIYVTGVRNNLRWCRRLSHPNWAPRRGRQCRRLRRLWRPLGLTATASEHHPKAHKCRTPDRVH